MTPPKLRTLLFVALMPFAEGTPLRAGSPAESSTALEQRLLADAEDGRLDRFSLMEAALIASGLDSESQLGSYSQRAAEHVARLSTLIPGDAAPQTRARLTFQYLHQHLLTGQYRTTYTEVYRTLDEGHFNCVTATVLYRYLGAAVGLPVATVTRAHHVYCQLADTPPIEIQPTSVHGFGVSRDDLRTADPHRLGTTAENTSPPRTLSDVQLVGKIYFNRGIGLLERRQFARALPLLETSCRLDPDDPLARRNLLACLNNWALAECDSGLFEYAAGRLLRGMQQAPDYGAFWDNDVYVHHCWVTHLCRQRDYAQALQVLEAARARRPQELFFREGPQVVRWLQQQAPVTGVAGE